MAGETLATLLARPRGSFQEGRQAVQELERGRLQNIIVGDTAANLETDRAAAVAAADLERRNTIAQRAEAAAKELREATEAERDDAIRTATDFAGIEDQAGLDAFKRVNPVDTKDSGLTDSVFGDEIFQAKMEDAGLILSGAERLAAVDRAPATPPKAPQTFEPILDAEGNEIAQRNIVTRQVVTSPLAPKQDKAAAAKAPAGFRFTPDGETLEPIPGGPQDPNVPRPPNPLSGEAAGRFAAVNQAIEQDIPFIIEKLFEGGDLESGDLQESLLLRVPFTQGVGVIREVRQAMRRTINAMLRMESGAVVTSEEIDEAMQTFMPDLIDTDGGARRKIRALMSRVRKSRDVIRPPTSTASVATAPVGGAPNDPLGIRPTIPSEAQQ